MRDLPFYLLLLCGPRVNWTRGRGGALTSSQPLIKASGPPAGPTPKQPDWKTIIPLKAPNNSQFVNQLGGKIVTFSESAVLDPVHKKGRLPLFSPFFIPLCTRHFRWFQSTEGGKEKVPIFKVNSQFCSSFFFFPPTEFVKFLDVVCWIGWMGDSELDLFEVVRFDNCYSSCCFLSYGYPNIWILENNYVADWGGNS